ncbi:MULTISPECIES: DUF4079 domain-containing protein [Cyanophyceae]|uniref:DUF4079 domain-containing protein n=1 Tax=Cyanophyceae TaxID=3028117 RepID=UPI0016871D18|nr:MULTISPECIES: DUF4079 domain-containing protein [Cyanophyceae]MBD1919292.1 DUF4079 domain-containing protein [Phormidium sp. FACHB-77]MBD2033011.1 DUF4079 domain-containing protein [Phormidium sp. FACHB-322]MBD2054199.1 DUF4079 domain-containing protein [Leptolyngbya sp. FACHB-60]
MLDAPDLLRLLHPFLAVTVVMPLIGVAVYFAVQTRQRRLAVADKTKITISPVVGKEHVRVGQWLSGAVVSLVLLGLAHPIFKTLLRENVWTEDPFRGVFVVAIYAFTLGALVLLYRSSSRVWRGTFATLTGMGLWLLGMQPGVFRRAYEWQVSHFYLGMAAAMLMIFALATLPEIYKSKRWRLTHAALNTVAVLLFISQGITGVRDLLEIPLQWQEPFIYQCDFENKSCS